jgi:integrase/recombinase XerD
MAVERLSDKALIDVFEKECHRKQLSPHTIESYVSSLNLFSQFLKKRKYTLLTVDTDIFSEYISYLQDNDIVQKTIKNRFSAYSLFYGYLVFKKTLENNVVKDVIKWYLPTYKHNGNNGGERKLISIKEMAHFIDVILDVRDRLVVVLACKTGIRRGELVAIDLDDIKWENMSIILKPTHKRSNRTVFFDYECALVLNQWLQKREHHADPENKALFVSYKNRKKRLNRNGVANMFVKWAALAGLHNPNSDKIEDQFTLHCCRHWFTTHLRRAGMPREHIKWLRGDAITDAMDIYYHIDPEDVRQSYLAHVPKLGIM